MPGRPVFIIFFIFLLILQTGAATSAIQNGFTNSERSQASTGEEAADLEVFAMEGCPHCTEAEPFLARLRHERPDLQIKVFDVSADEAARRRLISLAEKRGVRALGTPTFFVRGELVVGWQSEATTGEKILSLLPPARGREVEGLGEDGQASVPSAPERGVVELPIFGELSVEHLGLPLFTILLGLLDGFNPCAMWALLYLLSLLVNLHDRRKMFLIGGTFILVGGALYFAFMAAWLEVFLLIGLSRGIQVTLGAFALLIGVINVKDYFAFKKGFSLSIPESAKPGIYAQVRRVLNAQNVVGALVAVGLLSVLINLVELLCTAGFPAVYTEILTAWQLPRVQYYSYLALYIAAYILDDSIMLAIAVVTLGRRKLQERGGRLLKLVSGAVMVALGLTLLFKPDWVMR